MRIDVNFMCIDVNNTVIAKALPFSVETVAILVYLSSWMGLDIRFKKCFEVKSGLLEIHIT